MYWYGRSHLGGRRRTPILAIAGLTFGSVIVATMANPAAAAPLSSPRSTGSAHHTGAASARDRVVRTSIATLVTGDNVILKTWASGRTTTQLAKHSPDIGRRITSVHTPDGDAWVIPSLKASSMKRLDPSLFDVSRLAHLERGGAAVPLRLTFAKGVQPHSVGGISVAVGSAVTSDTGRTTVDAAYTPRSITGAGLDLRGVVAVSLAKQAKPSPSAGKSYQLRTLTVNQVGRNGKPSGFGFDWVQNIDNGALYTQPLFVIKGVGKAEVPEGHYAVWGAGNDWISIDTKVDVTKDTTVSIDGRDATIRPQVSLAGHHVLDTTLNLGLIAGHGGFIYGAGVTGTRIYVSPVPAKLVSGHFTTTMDTTLVRNGSPSPFSGKVPDQLVYAKAFSKGLPSSLDFSYTKSDFAIMHHTYDSTGPERTEYSFVYGFSRYDFFAFIEGLPYRFGQSQDIWVLGKKGVDWEQSVEGFFHYPPFEFMEQDLPIAQYKPGTEQTWNFFRGPVGPGLDGLASSDQLGSCALCRQGNYLSGSMGLASSGKIQGFVDAPGYQWQLSSGRKVYQRGSYALAPFVRLPAKRQTYTLSATFQPDVPFWKLSNPVDMTWRFSSAKSSKDIPLLIPAYHLTDKADSTVKAGPVSFRLNFGNAGPTDSRVADISVKYSVLSAGAWHKAKVTRLDPNSFRVSYDPPTGPGRRLVSIEIAATDAHGNTVHELAHDVYKTGKAYPGQSGDGQVSYPKGTRPACGTTMSATAARCYVLIQKRGTQALDKAGDPRGWGATDLRSAYGLTTMPQAGDTVGIVDAYDLPSAEADMNTYRQQYGLPPCTSKSGCFTKINEKGQTSHYPPSDDLGWGVETALDIEMVSAACPTCHIVLAEADSQSPKDLAAANAAAAALGATVISHSYGFPEYTGVKKRAKAYEMPGVTNVASSGDDGYTAASFPADVPGVLAVGGTTLHHALNARGWKESAWAFGGSGCSAYFAKPSYQTDAACPNRTSADMSAIADSTAVRDTSLPRRYAGWLVVAGTSVSSPFVAGMIGAADAAGLRPGALYANAGAFHDITRGANGYCKSDPICTAVPGYDGPTGIGTPDGLGSFQMAAKQ